MVANQEKDLETTNGITKDYLKIMENKTLNKVTLLSPVWEQLSKNPKVLTETQNTANKATNMVTVLKEGTCSVQTKHVYLKTKLLKVETDNAFL